MLRFLLSIEEEKLGDNVADMIACSTGFVADAIFKCHAQLQQNFAALLWIAAALHYLPIKLWSAAAIHSAVRYYYK